MTPVAVSIVPPFKHHGPASPEFLAKQREQALMINTVKESAETKGGEETQSRSAELIARGADPAEALGLEPEAPGGGGVADFTAGHSRLKQKIAEGMHIEAMVAAMASESQGADASRDLQVVKEKQKNFMAHKEALEGYAEAAQLFKANLAQGKERTDIRMN